MDSPRSSAPSYRHQNINGRALKRTSSDRSSSSSSGIHVGSLRTRPANHHHQNGVTPPEKEAAPPNDPPSKQTACRVVDGHLLIISLRPEQAASVNEFTSKPGDSDAGTINDDVNRVDGRNARGTFSREYALRHPEIKWVHRGQGRYLPAEEIKRDPPSVPERRSRHSRALHDGEREPMHIKTEQTDVDHLQPPARPLRSLSSEGRLFGSGDPSRHSIAPLPKEPQATPRRRAPRDSLTDALSGPPQYGLRHRNSETQPQTPLTESRAARLARRAKLIPSIELPGGTMLRTTSFTAEAESEADEDEMARDRKDTYDKDYVDAHLEEEFHHAGNGWYRKGPRTSGKGKFAEERDSERLTLTRSIDGTLNFSEHTSIHKSQLQKYPGMEFHHKGNGWYKPGPDPAGHRSSIVVEAEDGGAPTDGEDDEESEESEDEIDEGETVRATVDKAYKEAHPEIEWVHRGNGRYMRKVDVFGASIATAPSAEPAASERRKSEPTYSKEYIMKHPGEEFYHTGNARYKRGPRPGAKSAVPRSESESEDDGPRALFDKSYVDTHPHQEFHHRGQGRYARGPRPVVTPAREEESEEEDDIDTSQLYDSAFVNAHPNLTFHHKGQGRWAFGLPPLGSHNKVAVRGPGAKERMASRTSQEEEEEDEADMAPGLTALVIKAEGPDKFPNVQWHYRGGGKWGRITKQEAEHINSKAANNQKIGTISKYAGRKRQSMTGDGPAAQLERETAAASGEVEDGLGGVGGAGHGLAQQMARPKIKRGRKSQQAVGRVQQDANGSKDTSKSQSQAPKPKPRMLEPHEDILTDEDLPSIFRGEWSPPTGLEDPIDKQMRLLFPALNTNKVIGSLTKFDPAVRQLDVLHAIAANAQRTLDELQKEYVELDRITAQHAKIPRRPVKGGRVPVDPQIFEDRKEAELYDYQFDPRRVGHQDPQAQRIARDAEGRELRKRRNRSGVEPTDTLPGWRFGEEQLMEKRHSRQPNRYDANIDQPARKMIRAPNGLNGTSGSMTPDRAATPLGGAPLSNPQLQGAGRFGGNVPRRIQQLRGESVVSVRSEGGTVTQVRKGRPPGSKNLHKRRDAGIPKGPRKKKVVPADGGEGVDAAEVEGKMGDGYA